jgi:CO/xanthine dehydrogenase FAD-binding subunit
MKPAQFEYFAPETVAEATSILARYDGEAKVLAGGQSLVPLLNMRLARPQALVDINRVLDLAEIREDGDRLLIGAMTRQRDVERSDLVRRAQPLLHEAVTLIAHPQIRNRGTIGGSLAHADPASELPAVALALGAEFTITGPNGDRTLPAQDFFVTFLTTALQPDEVLTSISFPMQAQNTGSSVQEVARRHGDFALAGAAVTVTLDGDRCSDARIALFGVGAAAVRTSGAEEALRGAEASDAALDAAADAVRDQIDDPLTDIHASSDFRRHLARTMTRRALATAVERARNGARYA